jgi:hypothetical protein
MKCYTSAFEEFKDHFFNAKKAKVAKSAKGTRLPQANTIKLYKKNKDKQDR